MIPNTHPATGIAYGYISANALDSEIVDELMYGRNAENVSEKEAFEDMLSALENAMSDYLSSRAIDALKDYAAEFLNDEFSVDEPVVRGEYEGVKYISSWLGGALHFFITESPLTGHYRKCSPCVPNAGDLAHDDPGEEPCYDVPVDWRREEDA